MNQYHPIRWGNPDKQVHVPESFLKLISETLDLDPKVQNLYPEPSRVTIPPSELDDEAKAHLEELLGHEHVKTDHSTRLCHALGKSYVDIIRYCTGKIERAPDAVLYPENLEQLQEIVKWSNDQEVPLVPYGGGTSVVGGIEPLNRSLTVNLQRLNRILEIDEISGTVTVEPGILGPALENALNEKGFTLGHFPQSFEYSTVGGWISARSAGQQSTLYGKIEHLLIALHLLTPSGEIQTLKTPSEAMGPDLNQLFCGSEGVLGFITQATLRIHRMPESRVFVCGLLRTFEEGIETVRELMQRGLHPATVRLFDHNETVTLGTMRGQSFGMARRAKKWIEELAVRAQGLKQENICMMILSFEGTQFHTQHQAQDASRLIALHKGMLLGPGLGKRWYKTRFELPYMRDSLIQKGILVDTMETATLWSKVGQIHDDISYSIREALTSSSPNSMVLSHISHVYPEGASLYFTFLARAKQGEELLQWRSVQSSVMKTIMKHGAAISHHHGIGRLHAKYFAEQAGKPHMGILQAIKNNLDPKNVMNPGKLGL